MPQVGMVVTREPIRTLPTRRCTRLTRLIAVDAEGNKRRHGRSRMVVTCALGPYTPRLTEMTKEIVVH
jgi:hypothetical protein